jgi:hypothetical protein
LQPHIPSDDRLFPGRLASQLEFANQLEPEWNVEKIVTHQYAGMDAVFLVQWETGDHTWLLYQDIQHIEALQDYLDVLGVKTMKNL